MARVIEVQGRRTAAGRDLHRLRQPSCPPQSLSPGYLPRGRRPRCAPRRDPSQAPAESWGENIGCTRSLSLEYYPARRPRKVLAGGPHRIRSCGRTRSWSRPRSRSRQAGRTALFETPEHQERWAAPRVRRGWGRPRCFKARPNPKGRRPSAMRGSNRLHVAWHHHFRSRAQTDPWR